MRKIRPLIVTSRAEDVEELRSILEQQPQALADHGVVIGQQNANGLHTATGSITRTIAPSPGFDSTAKLPPR